MSFLRENRTLALVCLTIVSVATTIRAQQKMLWQGAVKPGQINVYASASTADQVTRMLKHGDMVDVVLEINVMGDAWCRIVLQGQSEALGYVLCLNLENNHVAPKHIARKEPVVTESHALASETSSTQKLTEATVVNPAVLTNKDILDMNKTGLPPEIVVAKIKSSPCNFNTSAAQLQQLKLNGLPDAVILAMVQAPSGSVVNDSAVLPKSASVEDVDPPEATPPSSPVVKVSQDLSISSGSQVFIEPMGGFETYLSAALQKKHVPLTIITSKERADFVITGASDTKKAGWAKIIFMGNLHSDEEASVTMINNKTGAVVFAYAVNKKNTLHGQQTSAEACAKHLKNRIEGKE
jgi:hypothetical protein